MKPLRAVRPPPVAPGSVVALLLALAAASCGAGDGKASPGGGDPTGAGGGESQGSGSAAEGRTGGGSAEAGGVGAGSVSGAADAGIEIGGPSAGSVSGAADAGIEIGGPSAGSVSGAADAELRVVRIIAIGDTGEGNLAQHQVADRMSEKCIEVGGCHAVIMNGDNFYDHGVTDTSDAQWGPKFEQPYDRPGLNGLPFYAVLGNHDHGPSSSGVRQAQIDYSRLPVGVGQGKRMSDKWHMPASYYDVRIRHVHLFGIDTVDFTSNEQADDMGARVAASDATWKIVFGHHPRYTSGYHFLDNDSFGNSGMYDMQRAIYCGADMYMGGHDHNLELIDKGRDVDCPNTYFAISGAGSKTRPASAAVPADPRQLFYTEAIEGFAYLRFEGDSLLFEFIDKHGAVLYAKAITK
ncbi:metallophosphoesterase [Sorangium sp. So ce233]|uniref:metallophosphoesterase n=1 Tax=Sorangium sp. So ce233 TaxID=3133290 RepID=UPI003F644173